MRTMKGSQKGFQGMVVTAEDFEGGDAYVLSAEGRKHTHFVIHTDANGRIRDMTPQQDFLGAIIFLLHERGYVCGTKEYEAAARKLHGEVQTFTRDEMLDFVNEGLIQWPITYGYVY